MSNYPLCEKAGLTIYEGDGYIDDNIKADAVERALERLKCVYIEPEPKEPAVMPNLGNQSPELGDLAFTIRDGVSLAKYEGPLDVIVNRILAEKLSRAPVVYGQSYEDLPIEWSVDRNPEGSADTHQARLIAITPIAKADTADELLREFMAFASEQAAKGSASYFNMYGMIERARALLAKGGE